MEQNSYVGQRHHFFPILLSGDQGRSESGDTIVVGHRSNFTDDQPLTRVYLAGTLDAAIWGAELAAGHWEGTDLRRGTNRAC